MRIEPHPRMRGIAIGDEVYCRTQHLIARVADVFPAAVCVKVATLSFMRTLELLYLPQLWRADDIESLSMCRYCGSREQLHLARDGGVPFQVCAACQLVAADSRVRQTEAE